MNKQTFRDQVYNVEQWLKEENGEVYEHDNAIAMEWVYQLYKQFKSEDAVWKALQKKHKQHPTKPVYLCVEEGSPFRTSRRTVAKDI